MLGSANYQKQGSVQQQLQYKLGRIELANFCHSLKGINNFTDFLPMNLLICSDQAV